MLFADRVVLQYGFVPGLVAGGAFHIAVELLHRDQRDPVEVPPLLRAAQVVTAMLRATGAEELALLNDFLGDVGTPDDHVILASAGAESVSRDSGRSNKQD